MKTKYIIFKNGKRIQSKPMTLLELWKRTKNLPCGGRVQDLVELGYELKQVGGSHGK